MKKNFKALKWMAGQARPFLLSFILIILLDALLSLCGVGIAILSKNLIDAASLGQRNKMVQFIIMFGILILVNVVLQIYITPLTAKTGQRISNKMRKGVFSHILMSEWTDFSKYHSGDVLTRLTSDIDIITNILMDAIPGIASLGVKFTAAFITLYIFEPFLALSAFALGPAAIIFSRVFGRRIKKIHMRLQETEGACRSLMQESLQHLLVVKSFSLEEKNIRRMGSIQDQMVGLALKKGSLSSAANGILGLGYWIGYFGAMVWGVLRLSDGKTSFGTLAAFLQLVGQIQSPFIGLAYTYPKIVSAMASAERLMELKKFRTEYIEEHSPSLKMAGINFSHVNFSYSNEKEVLRDVSFQINAGETAALIGPSGHGKTTIIRLILSFMQPSRGRICLTGLNGEELTVCSSTRSMISYVPQGNTLFSGTIRDNLLFGCPEASISDMEEALSRACALEFVEKLPQGISTVIGENGLGLSEGQAQRLAIARALLRRAPILILDEATSALDAATEQRVLSSIAGLTPPPTCLVITHRTPALEICSHVFKISDGQLAEHYADIMEAAATQEAWPSLP